MSRHTGSARPVAASRRKPTSCCQSNVADQPARRRGALWAGHGQKQIAPGASLGNSALFTIAAPERGERTPPPPRTVKRRTATPHPNPLKTRANFPPLTLPIISAFRRILKPWALNQATVHCRPLDTARPRVLSVPVFLAPSLPCSLLLRSLGPFLSRSLAPLLPASPFPRSLSFSLPCSLAPLLPVFLFLFSTSAAPARKARG